jgi:hypothetical protein
MPLRVRRRSQKCCVCIYIAWHNGNFFKL